MGSEDVTKDRVILFYLLHQKKGGENYGKQEKDISVVQPET